MTGRNAPSPSSARWCCSPAAGRRRHFPSSRNGCTGPPSSRSRARHPPEPTHGGGCFDPGSRKEGPQMDDSPVSLGQGPVGRGSDRGAERQVREEVRAEVDRLLGERRLIAPAPDDEGRIRDLIRERVAAYQRRGGAPHRAPPRRPGGGGGGGCAGGA